MEGITHVISLAGDMSPKSFKYDNQTGTLRRIIIDLPDTPEANILKVIKICINFIEQSIKCYIHCLAGVSRSSSIVIAYLMWKTHSDFDDVYFYVKSRRKWIAPNEGFVAQLRQFGELLKLNNYDLSRIKDD